MNNNLNETLRAFYDTTSMQWDTTQTTLCFYSSDSLTRWDTIYTLPAHSAVYNISTSWDSIGRITAGSSSGGMSGNSYTNIYDSLCTTGIAIRNSSGYMGGPGGYNSYGHEYWYYDNFCRPTHVIDSSWTQPFSNDPPYLSVSQINYYYADCNSLIVFGTDTLVTCLNQPALMNMYVYGGTAPYTFLWSSPDSLSDHFILNPIVYTDSGSVNYFTVTDSLGHQAQYQVVVAVNHFTSMVTDATCNTCSNGSIELFFPFIEPSYTMTVTPDTGSWIGNVLSGLPPGIYEICSGSSGCDFCDTIEVHYPDAIGEINGENFIHVFPNPAGGYFNVRIDNKRNEKISWTLRSFDGRVLKNDRTDLTQFTIQVENLSGGIYFLEIYSAAPHIVKIIKE